MDCVISPTRPRLFRFYVAAICSCAHAPSAAPSPSFPVPSLLRVRRQLSQQCSLIPVNPRKCGRRRCWIARSKIYSFARGRCTVISSKNPPKLSRPVKQGRILKKSIYFLSGADCGVGVSRSFYYVQGSANPRTPGCENFSGKLRQKW